MNNSFLEHVLLTGRWQIDKNKVCASAPGAMVQFFAYTSEISFELDGLAQFRLDVDEKKFKTFWTNEHKIYTVNTPFKDSAFTQENFHQYRLIKISESNPGKICLYNIDLGSNGTWGKTPNQSSRRIEFIGDSYTVGYGNLAEGINDGDPLEKTDASASYAFLIAESFKADFQINAVSGRGLVRNYADIIPEWTLSKLYDYTLFGSVPQGDLYKWDYSFHPQVIVIFVGINDFQGEGTLANIQEFKNAYIGLLDKLRKKHPGVKFLLVSTKIWPKDILTPIVQEIYNGEKAKGYSDLEYQVVFTDNTALHGHPSMHSHKDLANTLRPIIGRLGKFLAR